MLLALQQEAMMQASRNAESASAVTSIPKQAGGRWLTDGDGRHRLFHRLQERKARGGKDAGEELQPAAGVLMVLMLRTKGAAGWVGSEGWMGAEPSSGRPQQGRGLLQAERFAAS